VAVLVKYRVSAKDEAGYGFPVPLMDARRAIRLTRSKAKEWGIDPARIGVMGSSAGGHLASMCATMWDEKLPQETGDPLDALDCRPDFAILIYPVISMTEKWGHDGSKRRLLGPSPDPEIVARVSTEKRVNRRTPPCFLIHAADDSGVPARNSLEFAARCAENQVRTPSPVFSNEDYLAELLTEAGMVSADEVDQRPPRPVRHGNHRRAPAGTTPPHQEDVAQPSRPTPAFLSSEALGNHLRTEASPRPSPRKPPTATG
jgi:hypothetical protein